VLGSLILLGAKGVIAGDVEVIENSTRSGYHLLKLFLLIPRVVLLLIITLVVVVLLGVVVLVGGGVELLPLGAVSDEVVVSPHSKQPLEDILLSLRNLCKAQNFLTSKVKSSSGMLSYCSSEVAHKEDKTNFETDESVVLVGLATWPPIRVLLTKVLLVRETS
jgi:hypothetical protein